MFERILLPTDGSECSREATAHAADLADRYGGTVHVVAVVEAFNPDEVTEAHRERAAEQDVEPVLADLRAAGVDATSAVAAGVPAREILAAADGRDADLIAIGTHGRSGLRRQLLGSVTERVLRQADVPVLTVPPADDGAGELSYQDVLVPTDGSEGAEAATPLAVDLASTYGATLHAVSVVETPSIPADVRGSVFNEEYEAMAERAVEDLRAEAGLAAVETAVRRGTPHGEIDAYVRETGVDVVVMGTHGRTGLDRYLLGSVAENLIRTTAVPVLAVRTPAVDA